MHVVMHMKPNWLDFGTGIEQHIYGQRTDAHVIFNFIYRY